MPLDPFADIGRRAWFACPNCDHSRGCAECGLGRSCRAHWQYLLSNKGTVLHLQCPTCTYIWRHDTRHSRRDQKASGDVTG